MTLNDLELTQHAIEIHRNAGLLSYLTREGKEKSLFLAYKRIFDAADKAMERLNRLKYDKKE